MAKIQTGSILGEVEEMPREPEIGAYGLELFKQAHEKQRAAIAKLADELSVIATTAGATRTRLNSGGFAERQSAEAELATSEKKYSEKKLAIDAELLKVGDGPDSAGFRKTLAAFMRDSEREFRGDVAAAGPDRGEDGVALIGKGLKQK